ncbi:MAG: orotidine 5'-phosphate decarboxylase / HUMPS family protein [Nitrososphaeria archaeon]
MSRMLFDDLRSGRGLQVALDLLDLDLALRIAEAADRLGARVIEVGTPMIKRHGAGAIRAIRSAAGRSYVLADMKAADVGDLEVKIAAEAGADMVTVLGCSSDETVESALRASESYGVLLVVDLVNVEDPIRRYGRLRQLGARAFSFHVPIDVQRRAGLGAESLVDRIRSLGGDAIISVAGGLNPERIRAFSSTGVNLFVVGGYITGSPEYERRISEVLSAIQEL